MEKAQLRIHDEEHISTNLLVSQSDIENPAVKNAPLDELDQLLKKVAKGGALFDSIYKFKIDSFGIMYYLVNYYSDLGPQEVALLVVLAGAFFLKTKHSPFQFLMQHLIKGGSYFRNGSVALNLLAMVVLTVISIQGIVRIRISGNWQGDVVYYIITLAYLIVVCCGFAFGYCRCIVLFRLKKFGRRFSNLDLLDYQVLLYQYVLYLYDAESPQSGLQSEKLSLLHFMITKIISGLKMEQCSSILLLSKFPNSYALALLEGSAQFHTALSAIVCWDITCMEPVLNEDQVLYQARIAASKVFSEVLMKYPRFCKNLASVPGLFEAIFSLIDQENLEIQQENRMLANELKNQGLMILNMFAENPAILGDVGRLYDLVNTLSGYLDLDVSEDDGGKERRKMALMMLRRLAQTEHKNQFSRHTVRKVWDIVQGEEAKNLIKKICLHILTGLATDNQGREGIRNNSKGIQKLFQLLRSEIPDGADSLYVAAADALYAITYDGGQEDGRRKLIGFMPMGNDISKSVQQLNTGFAKILLNLLQYASWEEYFLLEAFEKSVCMLQQSAELNKQESALRLMIGLVPLISSRKLVDMIKKDNLMTTLLPYLSIQKKMPCLRRHAVALIVALMEKKENDLHTLIFKQAELKDKILHMKSSTSDSENFCVELEIKNERDHSVLGSPSYKDHFGADKSRRKFSPSLGKKRASFKYE